MLRKESTTAHKVDSFKYRLNCKDRITDAAPSTESWMQVQKILSDGHPVLKSVLEQRKDIVVKFQAENALAIHSDFMQQQLILKGNENRSLFKII